MIRRYPFLTLGVLTLLLFLAIEAMPESATAAPLGRAVITILRVLIAPLWLMRTVEMLAGMGDWPLPLQLIIALPLLLLPYGLADLLLARRRRRVAARSASAHRAT